jgi:hypothetical protein
MKDKEALDPTEVTFFSFVGVVPHTQHVPELVKKFWLSRHRIEYGELNVNLKHFIFLVLNPENISNSQYENSIIQMFCLASTDLLKH